VLEVTLRRATLAQGRLLRRAALARSKLSPDESERPFLRTAKMGGRRQLGKQ
jgi:hypothetical protein